MQAFCLTVALSLCQTVRLVSDTLIIDTEENKLTLSSFSTANKEIKMRGWRGVGVGEIMRNLTSLTKRGVGLVPTPPPPQPPPPRAWRYFQLSTLY